MHILLGRTWYLVFLTWNAVRDTNTMYTYTYIDIAVRWAKLFMQIVPCVYIVAVLLFINLQSCYQFLSLSLSPSHSHTHSRLSHVCRSICKWIKSSAFLCACVRIPVNIVYGRIEILACYWLIRVFLFFCWFHCGAYDAHRMSPITQMPQFFLTQFVNASFVLMRI